MKRWLMYRDWCGTPWFPDWFRDWFLDWFPLPWVQGRGLG